MASSLRAGVRMSADDRRRAVLVAAVHCFAAGGYEGTSTEDIAKVAGISQPYLFRLFGTKRELFIAAVLTGFDRVRETFEAASEGLEGQEALEHMGLAYIELLSDSDLLRLQLHGYAACSNDAIQVEVAKAFAALLEFIGTRTGASPEEIRDFVAMGMMLNVVAALNLPAVDGRWAGVLCMPDLGQSPPAKQAR